MGAFILLGGGGTLNDGHPRTFCAELVRREFMHHARFILLVTRSRSAIQAAELPSFLHELTTRWGADLAILQHSGSLTIVHWHDTQHT